MNKCFQPRIALTPYLTLVGTSRCDVSAREIAGGRIAPLHAARTAQRAVPTWLKNSRREIMFRGILSRRTGEDQGEGREVCR